jgi:hypothetical protein
MNQFLSLPGLWKPGQKPSKHFPFPMHPENRLDYPESMASNPMALPIK